MQQTEYLHAWLRLHFINGIGPVTFLRLIKAFGSPIEVFSQNLANLSTIVDANIARSILVAHSRDADAALIWQSAAPNRHLITLNDAAYPPALAQIHAPPPVLFAEGRIELLMQHKIAIVGTRHPSTSGRDNALLFSKDLSQHNITIVSGLAAGIDRYAHEGALHTSASTIAVVGNGIDIIYPNSNRNLFTAIAEFGLIISEYPLGMRPLAVNFPRRNRIIVGLSMACLVIESGVDGGSMISASLALDMGREVMAVPGSIHQPMARGCHKLIKLGAKLIETTSDILDELEAYLQHKTYITEVPASFNEINCPILHAMGWEPISAELLHQILQIDFSQLLGSLLELELAGAVKDCGNGYYQRSVRLH